MVSKKKSKFKTFIFSRAVRMLYLNKMIERVPDQIVGGLTKLDQNLKRKLNDYEVVKMNPFYKMVKEGKP